MRSFLLLGTATVLAGCQPALPPEQNFVPYEQVLAETQDRPYECVGYDRASDTCQSIGTTVLRANKLIADGTAAIALDRVLTMDFSGTGWIDDGRACTNFADVKMTTREELTDSENFAMGFFDAAMELLGEEHDPVCTAYFRAGENYDLVSRNRDEEIIPEGIETVHFFAQPKQLSPIN